ncbi:MAG TPA: rod shape-determining protein MreD [Candidatus Aminicenantes bacterium]|nr:rod shape-determining protein MreD [Candidatus Aminicenantes bacterium]
MRDSAVRDVLQAFLGTLLAVAVYALAGAAAPGLLVVFNAFSVVVLCFAVRRGEVFGALLGTMCGLAQDAFSLGVFGVAGLSKTMLGFWAGYVSRRIDVASWSRNALFMLALAVLETALWVVLTAVVRAGPVNLHGGLIALQPVVTAALGTAFLALGRWAAARRARGA